MPEKSKEPGQKIRWLSWGEGFERAKKEDKPLLLDIHGVWCHWCHVMDDTTYSDPEVIRKVNKNFVPVKVDTDRRPDINERYNQGGWPTTAFLTPSGHVITGGTYIPPARMPRVIDQVIDAYKSGIEEPEIVSREEEVVGAAVSQKIVDRIADLTVENFDIHHGGFGRGQKFPMTDAVDLALFISASKGDKSFLKLATITLDNTLGIYDSAEGGFHRYAVRPDWTEPHYEKMLDTNTGLLLNYMRAYQTTGESKYRRIAEGTAGYVSDILSDGRVFYGSQDAGAEEEYYGKTLEERQKLETPYVDKTVYADLNARAASAFLVASVVLENGGYRKLAMRAVDFLLSECMSKSMCHYHDGSPRVRGLLADQVWTMRALLDAWQLTADRKYLSAAEKLAGYIKTLRSGQGFCDRSPGGEGYMKVKKRPIGGNAAAADVLTDLSIATGNAAYRKMAGSALRTFAKSYSSYSMHAASYALAVAKFIKPAEIHAVDITGEQKAKLFAHFDPTKFVVSGGRASEKAGYDEPGIYVCAEGACKVYSSYEEYASRAGA